MPARNLDVATQPFPSPWLCSGSCLPIVPIAPRGSVGRVSTVSATPAHEGTAYATTRFRGLNRDIMTACDNRRCRSQIPMAHFVRNVFMAIAPSGAGADRRSTWRSPDPSPRRSRARQRRAGRSRDRRGRATGWPLNSSARRRRARSRRSSTDPAFRGRAVPRAGAWRPCVRGGDRACSERRMTTTAADGGTGEYALSGRARGGLLSVPVRLARPDPGRGRVGCRAVRHEPAGGRTAAALSARDLRTSSRGGQSLAERSRALADRWCRESHDGWLSSTAAQFLTVEGPVPAGGRRREATARASTATTRNFPP